MINPQLLPLEARRAQFAPNEIDAVQSPAAWIEPEDRNTKLIGSIDCLRTNTTANKDQSATTVSRDGRRRALHECQSNVPLPVLDPAEVARPIHIADASGFNSCHDSVHFTEVSHPLGTKVDRFFVRCSTPSWLWRSFHKSRVHPSSDNRRTRLPLAGRPSLVGGES